MSFESDDQRKAVMARLNGNKKKVTSHQIKESKSVLKPDSLTNRMYQMMNSEGFDMMVARYNKLSKSDFEKLDNYQKQKAEDKFIERELSQIYIHATDDDFDDSELRKINNAVESKYGSPIIAEKYLNNSLHLEHWMISEAIKNGITLFKHNFAYRSIGEKKQDWKRFNDNDSHVEWRAKDIAVSNALAKLSDEQWAKAWDGLPQGQRQYYLEMVNGYGDYGFPVYAARDGWEGGYTMAYKDAMKSAVRNILMNEDKPYVEKPESLMPLVAKAKPAYRKWDGKIFDRKRYYDDKGNVRWPQ